MTGCVTAVPQIGVPGPEASSDMLEAFVTAERAYASPWVEPRDDAPLAAEAELVALARAPVALRRALARVAGRMVATRGWERLGFARLADYAAERAGLSARELRDLALVDQALGELPELEAAFLARRIGWTQLRLLCRVARPEDERDWLEVAARLSARALAREVRAVDERARQTGAATGSAEEDDETRAGVAVRCTPQVRARWWHARQLANRVAGHTLSPAAFVEALTGEVLSAVPLEVDCEDAKRVSQDAIGSERVPPSPLSTDPAGRDPVGGADGSPAAAPGFAAALERDLDDADAFELDARLGRAVRLEAQHLARVASLLEVVVAFDLHRDRGFGGLDAYAEERLGMAPSRARALLRIARAGGVCPPLREAFAAGRLSWVQAHILVPLLLDPGAAAHRLAWIEHAARVSVRRLRDDVERAIAIGVFAPGAVGGRDDDGLQTGAKTRSRPDNVRLFFAASPELAHLFRAALATVQRRLERIRGRPSCESEALAAMLEHAIEAWEASGRRRGAVPREHRVLERDGWRCTAPGCSSYRNLHAHHVVFRSRSGSDEFSNLTALCAWHHQRGIHGGAGVLRCTGTAPSGLRFELGLRAGHPPLAAYGPGEVLL